MAVPVSSLSVAIQGIADFLDSQFGEDVAISTDTPQKASDRAKGSDKHLLNVFAYRVLPSGFHAATAFDEPFFIRINALITPFLTEQDGTALDADLRILGHAIRVLHSRPIVPGVLPGASAGNGDFREDEHLDYRLQAVLQAPSVEELNNIWTTQGGELAYRLSAAYEFALIPIEPLEHRIEAGPVTSSVLDIEPNVEVRDATGFIDYGDDPMARPLGGIGAGRPKPPTNWLPVVLITDGGALSNSGTVAEGATSVNVAVAGPPGERVALEVSWVRADSSEDTQAPQVVTIASPSIDDAAAITALNLDDVEDGDVATVHTRPVDNAGQPLPTSPFAHTLSLTAGPP